jgi:pimeloyl-ACP methyl ester carboxylesterase
MAKLKANGLDFEYDIHGDDGAEPLLLIMGLGAQMTRWSPDFIAGLTSRGFRVIRYDNRDIGLSDKMDAAGMPDLAGIFTALAEGRPATAPYTLSDMADDAAGVLDALEIDRAHLVGASMGGMIAQLVAINHSHRTRSLTSIMSTTGHPDLPRATPEAMARLTTPAPNPADDMDAYVAHFIASARVIGSPDHQQTEEQLRQEAVANVARSYYPMGFMRQYAAIAASPHRRDLLARVTAPTTVIHGIADPLVPVEGGRDTAASIPGAVLVEIPGMGHDIPAALYGHVWDAISAVAARAT